MTGEEAPWGTAGEHCYCTTGDSDFCDFCDEWVRDCSCWKTDNDEESSSAASALSQEALAAVLESWADRASAAGDAVSAAALRVPGWVVARIAGVIGAAQKTLGEDRARPRWRSESALELPPPRVRAVSQDQGRSVAVRGVFDLCDECGQAAWLWRWIRANGQPRDSPWVCFHDLDAVGGFEQLHPDELPEHHDEDDHGR